MSLTSYRTAPSRVTVFASQLAKREGDIAGRLSERKPSIAIRLSFYGKSAAV
jgi:hypothetical protein